MTLKELLYMQGMNGADVARALDVTRTNISHWVTGKNRPSVTNVHKLADALGVEYSTVYSAVIETSRKVAAEHELS